MNRHSKVQHGVPPDSLVRLKPHKLGRHHHKVPEHIIEAANKYPRVIVDYFLRNFRVHLEQKSVAVSETVSAEPACIFRSALGKVGFSIARPLLSDILESYYGGVSVPKSDSAPISTSEERMRERLGRDIGGLFGRAIFSDSTLGNLEIYENAYDRPVWDYQIEFIFENHTTSTCAPLTLYLDNQLSDLLTSRMAAPGLPYRLGDPMASIRHLPVRMECVIASVQMQLTDVLALQPNDVVMIRLQERCDVRIAQQKLFRGAIFENDGSLCLTSLESVNPT